jgi:SAP domain-containing new25/Domain of unknown function (DUF6434)
MRHPKSGKDPRSKPVLRPGITVTEYRAYYWMKDDLIRFARQLGLPTYGYKPELSARIEQRLQGIRESAELQRKQSKGPRDSDKPIRRDTPVINYKSDDKTRAFFKSEIGPGFHFTYLMNQYRLAHDNLTYGDLVDVWVAERNRRRNPDYKPALAEHGKYNRFIRDFFDDERNKGKSLGDAAKSWNAIKNKRGDPRYTAPAKPPRGSR